MSRLTRWLRQRISSEAPNPGLTIHGIPPLWQPGFPVVVCWSAKAGCTTVLKWFLHHVGLAEAAQAHHAWPHRYRAEVLMAPIDRYVHRCHAAVRRGGTDVVKVVRDPARRAVSSYLHAIRYGMDPGWDPGVEAWKQRVGLGRQPGLSFEQFLNLVIDARSTGGHLDSHFQPQWAPGWDAFVERVIPLEQIASGLADVEDRHGLRRTDVRSFSESRHHNTPDAAHRWPDAVARFAATKDDLSALGTPPAEAFLDERTIALVQAAYDCDYEAYGRVYQPRLPAVARRAI